jgi:large subunit ribosomal protein L47
MASASSFRPLSGRLLRTNSISGNCLQQSVSGSAAYFSTTSPLCRRKRKTNKDNNPSRGVSSIYRSGPREPLSMSSIPLPRPREDFRPTVKVDPNHGLWGFFPASGKLLWTPEETEQHGRPWTVEELRRKSWEDLHALWWVCCKERNRLATARVELNRSKLGFGARELEMRDDTVCVPTRLVGGSATI